MAHQAAEVGADGGADVLLAVRVHIHRRLVHALQRRTPEQPDTQLL